MGTPIKLEGGSGDLKEMSTAEEQWLAYQCGLRLAAMATTSVAALRLSATGSTSIGSYSNTFFNQAVGTHPGSSITTGTTTTTVYQTAGTAGEAGTDFHRPIRWNGSAFEEMDDTELNTLVDRLLGLTFANSYPGDYYLGSSSPGATYDTHIAGVFSDTRTDGTSVTYNIYQRQSVAAPPTEVKCVKVYNDVTSFDGLKEMSNTEIAYTLGQRMKTRIMSSANNIGAYQLRSSAQGAPVAAGTWVAKGTATDTKQTTADVAYSADYIGDYVGNYTGNYSGTYAGDYVGNYTGNYTGTYSAAYSATYVGNYTGTYSATYIGYYTNPNAINYINQRFHGTFFVGGGRSYPQYYVGDYLGPATYTGNYVGNYSGTYAGDYVGNYTGNYSGTYSAAYSADYIGNYSGTYSAVYSADYLGNYTGNYSGETIQSGSTTVETYTLYVRTA